jgi:hypothetical protein
MNYVKLIFSKKFGAEEFRPLLAPPSGVALRNELSLTRRQKPVQKLSG